MQPKFTTVFTRDLHCELIQYNIRGVVNLLGTTFNIILLPTLPTMLHSFHLLPMRASLRANHTLNQC
jgi:hypothetical protein